MAEVGPEYPEYAIKHARGAVAIRQALPEVMQSTLLEVTERLAENPDEFPHRNRSISRDGNIVIYTHPNPKLEITYEIDRENKILYFVHFAAPQLEVDKLLFISYSHQDKEWLEKLNQFLTLLYRDDRVVVWADTEIKPGQEWQKEIENALQSAKVAVILASPNFIASDFIANNELPQLLDKAKKGGLTILWIAISSYPYEDTAIGKYQAVNDPNMPLDTLKPGEQNKELTEIYRKIKAAIGV